MPRTSKKAAPKKAAKKAAKKASGKRTTISPRGDKRFVRRNDQGEFSETVDAGKSLSRDRKKTAKKKVKPGYGDQGDQKKRGAKKAAKKKAAKKK
jgi:hypothetical protein